jgi:hypothetical protein
MAPILRCGCADPLSNAMGAKGGPADQTAPGDYYA